MVNFAIFFQLYWWEFLLSWIINCASILFSNAILGERFFPFRLEDAEFPTKYFFGSKYGITVASCRCWGFPSVIVSFSYNMPLTRLKFWKIRALNWYIEVCHFTLPKPLWMDLKPHPYVWHSLMSWPLKMRIELVIRWSMINWNSNFLLKDYSKSILCQKNVVTAYQIHCPFVSYTFSCLVTWNKMFLALNVPTPLKLNWFVQLYC